MAALGNGSTVGHRGIDGGGGVKEALLAKPVKMPPVEVGETVLWYPGGAANEIPSPAVVTHVGAETLALSVLVKDCPVVSCVDGVRHLADPKLVLLEDRSSGAWDHTPQGKALRMILNDKKG
jgi:hypothetical protein